MKFLCVLIKRLSFHVHFLDFFFNTLLLWTASIDFKVLNLHDYLLSYPHSRQVSLLYTTCLLGIYSLSFLMKCLLLINQKKIHVYFIYIFFPVSANCCKQICNLGLMFHLCFGLGENKRLTKKGKIHLTRCGYYITLN